MSRFLNSLSASEQSVIARKRLNYKYSPNKNWLQARSCHYVCLTWLGWDDKVKLLIKRGHRTPWLVDVLPLQSSKVKEASIGSWRCQAVNLFSIWKTLKWSWDWLYKSRIPTHRKGQIIFMLFKPINTKLLSKVWIFISFEGGIWPMFVTCDILRVTRGSKLVIGDLGSWQT